MTFLTNYWWIFIIIAAVIVAICGFIKLPTKEQISKIKEWLLYAVTEAEKELGSGTGQIKLRYVYDIFLNKFSFLAKIISFDTFSLWVDEVLEKFKTLLESNSNLQEYVNSSQNDD